MDNTQEKTLAKKVQAIVDYLGAMEQANNVGYEQMSSPDQLIESAKAIILHPYVAEDRHYHWEGPQLVLRPIPLPR